jgi:hypothetical protein
VQTVLAIIVLLVLPSPVQSSMPLAAAAVVTVVVAVLVAALLASRLYRGRPSRWASTLRTATSDVRKGLLARQSWPGILFASSVVVAGHAATFVIAARVAGSTASPGQLLPLALLVLFAMGVPVNIGGWGPREGVAAWAFAAAGLGAAQGLATAVVYGVMVLVASLPGVAVLGFAWLRRDGGRARRIGPPHWRMPIGVGAASAEGAGNG